MVKTVSKLILLASFLLLLNACVTDINIQLPLVNSIVLNGIIVPNDTISISLHRSQQQNDTINFEVIENATVSLYENEIEIGKLKYLKNGTYQSNVIAKELTAYKIEVVTQDGEKLWATTTTPSIEITTKIHTPKELDSTAHDWPYYLELSNLNTNDFELWICVTQKYMSADSIPIPLHKLAYSIYTNSPLADQFNMTYDPESYTGYYYDYSEFLHFNLIGLQKDTILIDFYASRGSKTNETIHVFNMDQHYSNYLKSKLINEQGPDYLTDDGPPLNYKPAFLYSNVHGGMGILGSYTTFTKTYTY
ncbi:MAG: DUF4249 family protein [Prolixibacteraceae bacterium]|jgi:hypothetical protein|nr:DUF4249 family protein [Prolixibacteraceae bacterium]